MGKIFGTDGARGVVGRELTAELAFHIGSAAAQVITKLCAHQPTVLIGKDTRGSGDMLEAAVAAGICSVGANVLLLGVVSTPAVAYLVNKYGADAGVMISASHNSYEYNGIKLFGSTGYKLTDSEEEEIEALILGQTQSCAQAINAQVGRIGTAANACNDYVEYLAAQYCGAFSGKILVDCANGSASATARQLFSRLNLDADFLFDSPDGININEQCGSTHIEQLAEKVLAGGYSLGLAFDGDADRLLCVDEKGKVLDGDYLLCIFASYLQQVGRLNRDTVVVTTMSNMGFFKLMVQRGMQSEVTKVGDRYVLECMLEKNLSLGGEQSGHIIFIDKATTGDGQLSAVELLNALSHFDKPMSELAAQMTKYPQILTNVTVNAAMKQAFAANEAIAGCIAAWEQTLGEDGRIVVRPSGTEPYIRVMVEGANFTQIERCANEISEKIKQQLA